MRILIIDNNIDLVSWGSADLCRVSRLVPSATLTVRRAPQSDLPKSPSAFDRIIVSGSKTSAFDDSPWVGDLVAFIKKALSANIPFLGICYGHQILTRALDNQHLLRKSESPEFGWTPIEIIDSSPLFYDFPTQFYSFSAHFEEVGSLPPGTKRLAQSNSCFIQAYQVERSPVFGIQFHPEKSLQAGEATIKERIAKKSPSHLLNPKLGHKLYDPKVGDTLFKNFFKL